jgi:hypothetical protein
MMKKGELIRIVSKKYNTRRFVTVESLHDDESFIEVPTDTIALFLGSHKATCVAVYVQGFIGWVYGDEWESIENDN